MLQPLNDLADLLNDARVVILITDAHPDGLILHPPDSTAAVKDDES